MQNELINRYNIFAVSGGLVAGDTLQNVGLVEPNFIHIVSPVAVSCPWGSMSWKWCLIRSCWCSIIVANHMVVMAFRLSNPHYIQSLSLSLSLCQSSLSYASFLFVIVGKFLKMFLPIHGGSFVLSLFFLTDVDVSWEVFVYVDKCW